MLERARVLAEASALVAERAQRQPEHGQLAAARRRQLVGADRALAQRRQGGPVLVGVLGRQLVEMRLGLGDQAGKLAGEPLGRPGMPIHGGHLSKNRQRCKNRLRRP